MGKNLICNTGLNSLFTALALSNTKLKFIDLGYNLIDECVSRALHLLLTKNQTLKYLVLSDLHTTCKTTNEVMSLGRSFSANKALRMVDLKVVSQEFYEYLDSNVNHNRAAINKIEFRRDM